MSNDQETNFVPDNYTIGTKVKEEIEMDCENNVEFESYWMNSVVKVEETDWNKEQPNEIDESVAQKSEATQKRRKRNTTDEQYEIYLQEMETNYTLISKIKNPTHANLYMKKFWDNLKDKLNSSASGPKLTSSEWKKRFKDWKNATRTKQRKLELEIRKTGGRTKPNITLTALEKRGLAVWGKATVKNYSENNLESFNTSALSAMATECEQEVTHQPEVSQPGTSTSSNWEQYEYLNNDDSSATNECLIPQETRNIVSSNSTPPNCINSTPPSPDVNIPTRESSPTTHTPLYRQKQSRRINKRVKKNISFNELGAMLVEQCEGNNRITSTIANVLKDFGKKYLEIEKRKLEFQIACYKFENPKFKFD